MKWMHLAATTGLLGLALACGEREEPLSNPVAAQSVSAASAAAEKSAKLTDDLQVPPPLLPRGLITNDAGVTPGYVLFNPSLSDTAYLVDNLGRVVHVWKTPYAPGGAMELLPNGNLLRGTRDPEMLGFKTGGTSGILQELDWEGRVVWEWKLSDAGHVLHHDIEPMPNGNVLVLAWEVKSPAEARSAGRRVEQIPEQGLWPDVVLEIEPVRPKGAKIVWEWHVWDRLVQDHDPTASHYGDPTTRWGRLDLNAGGQAPQIDAAQLEQLKALGYVPADATPQDLRADFLHVNAVAYHPRLDQIALSSPVMGEVWIIDHSTTTAEAKGSSGGRAGKGGDFLYRWGNPAAYRRGSAADQVFFYQHDVRWIPDGWEGAGNLTVFNNGRGRLAGPWSSVDEWTPSVDADGGYANPGDGAFAPAALAWQYRASDPTSLYAPVVSGAHRLANGNTLITAGTGGRFLEVTRAGEVVWEYRNPFWGDVRNVDGSLPQPRIDERPFAVFRATRVPEGSPALAGRALAPLDPQPAWYEWKPKAP